MDNFTQTLISIENGDFTISQMVSILVLIESKIDINTVSGMARSEKKTPRGIKISSQYRKINIGSQLMAVKGLKDDKLPF